MGKQQKVQDAQKDGKKRKHQDAAASDAPAKQNDKGNSFLFGGNSDAQLDDIFGKSASFAREVPALPAPVPVVVAAAEPEAPVPGPSKKAKKDKSTKKSKSKLLEPTADEDPEEPISTPSAPVASTSAAVAFDEAEGSGEDDDQDGESDLVHESMKPGFKKGKERVKGPKTKFVPSGETSGDRDRRTIFVGNLPIETAKSKSALNQLRSHIITFTPSAKIESVRFRSVPFGTPTSGLPTEGETENDENKRANREKDRAAAWRAHQEVLAKGGEAAEEVDKAETFIDSKGKRKVAFIKKDFHNELGSCNAYVVFAHPHPDRAANVAPITDPYEAATQALAANGSTFMDRTIRVDSLRLPSALGLQSATNALSKRDAWLPTGTDPKNSVFVGGLDYAAKEEDVRVFFEELVKKERGPAEGSGSWVTGVRIVRDKETQLGKGFGYVHFVDRESADEIIAMDSSKLKFAKKPLRVQPCKTLPPSMPTRAPPAPAKSTTTGKAAKGRSALGGPGSGPMPKGNPALGDKLKDLSKEDRKAAKMADADRQARRLAKKKMRHDMKKDGQQTGAVKLTASRAEKEKGKRNVKAKKSRVRSSANLAHMKGSRT